MDLRSYEEHFAKDIVLNVINKYIKTDSFEDLSSRFNEKRATQILSSEFPSEDILENLVMDYKNDIKYRGVMTTNGRKHWVLSNIFNVFHREDVRKRQYPKEE